MVRSIISKYKLYLPVVTLLLLMLLFKVVIGETAATFFILASEVLVFYIFFLFFYKLRNPIRKSMQVRLNTQFFPAFRIIYVLICLYSFFQNITLIESQLEPSNLRIIGLEFSEFYAYLFNGIYLLSLLAIAVGYRIRLAFILLFITGGIVIPFSLEIFLKNIINFYAIFIPTYAWYGKKSPKGQYDGWAVVLMVISFSFLMSVAGICKLFDPVWQDNLGLYYTLNVPYMTPEYLWPLLDYYGLLVVLNWLTIFVEVVCFPFVFFKKTRIISLYCLVFLGLFLAFMMWGIGIVGGPVVLAGCLLALSITNIPNKLSKYIPKIRLSLIKGDNHRVKSHQGKYIGLLLYAVTLIHIVFYSIDLFIGSLNYKEVPKYANYNIVSEQYISEKSPVHKALKTTSKTLKKIEVPQLWRFVWSLSLFDYHHLFERRCFRVVFEDKQGNTSEPTKYYNDDGSLSSEHPLYANERFFFLGFRIMEVLEKEEMDTSTEGVKLLVEEMNAIIRYSNKGDKKFTKAKILLKNLYQPYGYQKEHKPWIDENWFTFYIYELDTGKETIIDSIPRYDYSKLKIKEFKEGIITPNF